jgi:hypothetical protein
MHESERNRRRKRNRQGLLVALAVYGILALVQGLFALLYSEVHVLVTWNGWYGTRAANGEGAHVVYGLYVLDSSTHPAAMLDVSVDPERAGLAFVAFSERGIRREDGIVGSQVLRLRRDPLGITYGRRVLSIPTKIPKCATRLPQTEETNVFELDARGSLVRLARRMELPQLRDMLQSLAQKGPEGDLRSVVLRFSDPSGQPICGSVGEAP